MTHPENQCNGKQQYATAEQANEAVSHVNKRGGQRVKSYKCSDCDMWHFGHNGYGKKLKKYKRLKVKYEDKRDLPN